MDSFNERKQVLYRLILFKEPLQDIKNELSSYAWDVEEDILCLDGSHLTNLLKRYINLELSLMELEDWANFVEVRDDIGYESKNAEIINEIIYKLANPTLEGELTIPEAKSLILKINQ